MKWLIAAVATLSFGAWIYLQRKKFVQQLGAHLPKRFLMQVAGTARFVTRVAASSRPDNKKLFGVRVDAGGARHDYNDGETNRVIEMTIPELPPLPSSESTSLIMSPGANLTQEETPSDAEPSMTVERHRVVCLHAAVWTYDGVLDRLSGNQAIEVLNEFHALGATWAQSLSGIYERSSGVSFFVHWVADGEDLVRLEGSMKCALMLRQEFARWSELRKTESHLPLTIVMGADTGLALWARLGPKSRRADALVGEVVSRARALSQIAVSLGTDVLVSEDLWSTVSKRYVGERVADAQLTALGGLTACFRVKGYWGDQGQEVLIPPSGIAEKSSFARADSPRIDDSNQPKKWRVNTGSQILGPVGAAEVAKKLYTQDLDFDCECWEDGSASRMTLEKSGIFGVGSEEGAHFWVFDGETIHGPLTEGFLKTGLNRHVFPRDAMVCERSTLNGWRPLMDVRSGIEIEAPLNTEASVNMESLLSFVEPPSAFVVSSLDLVEPPASLTEATPSFVEPPIDLVGPPADPVKPQQSLVEPMLDLVESTSNFSEPPAKAPVEEPPPPPMSVQQSSDEIVLPQLEPARKGGRAA